MLVACNAKIYSDMWERNTYTKHRDVILNLLPIATGMKNELQVVYIRSHTKVTGFH
jgi:hypothetical protein